MFEDLIPELQPFAAALVRAAGDAGLLPRVTSTRRSHALQKKLYDRFLSGASQYPALPPGRSAHEYGYAFDLVVSPMSALEDVGYTWEQWGGIWGGHASDPIHFEYPGFVPPDDVGYISGAVREAARVYEQLPWYAQIFTPVAGQTAEGSIEEASAGSPGARFLCNLGVRSFC